MKSFKNKLIVASLVIVGNFVAYAAVTTTVQSPASGVTSVTTAPATSSSFTFINTNAAKNSTVYVYDAPGTNVTYVLTPSTNYTFSVGSITNSWTNYLGVVNSNIFTGLITTTNSSAQITNFYPLAGVFIVSSNTAPGLGVLPANFNYNFRYGILVTNDNSVSVTGQYAQ